jgi:hypothetical protein
MVALSVSGSGSGGGGGSNVKKVYSLREKQHKRYGSKALGLVSSGGLCVDHIWDVFYFFRG